MDSEKFIKLAGYLLLSVVGFLLGGALIFVLIRLLFGILSYIPWLNYFYALFILSVPAAFFISVYFIFFRRTAFHPSARIRVVSKTIFILFIVAWMVAYVLDLVTFYRIEKTDIENYYSYNTLFLTINVTSIFLTGVMQALTTEKEKDWMDKHRDIY